VKSDPGFVSMVGWVILLANLVAIPVCLLFLPTFSFIATLKQRAVMPVALILSMAAAIVVMPHPISLVQIAIFGAAGLALKLAHWPRAPLLLGFVMGPIIESTLWRTVNVFGMSAFERPGLILLLVIMVTALAWSRVKARKRQKVDIHSPPSPVLGLDVLGLVLFSSAAYAAFAFPPPARLFPVGASVLGFCCCLVVLLEDLSARNYWSEWKAWREVELDALLPALGLVAASPLVGFPFATLLYVPLALLWSARTRLAYALLTGAGAAMAAYALVQDPIGLIRPFNALWRVLVWI
jgi:putative tricarboxylic transport membrane protein